MSEEGWVVLTAGGLLASGLRRSLGSRLGDIGARLEFIQEAIDSQLAFNLTVS
jgi:hypothetical protein